MAEKELRAAHARAEQAQARFTETLAELKRRVQPSTLAGDAWDGVKDKGSDLADKGVRAVKDQPVAAGGIVAALAVFLFRAPLATLVTSMFGKDEEEEGRVTTDLSTTDDDYDLTAPVVAQKEGAIA